MSEGLITYLCPNCDTTNVVKTLASGKNIHPEQYISKRDAEVIEEKAKDRCDFCKRKVRFKSNVEKVYYVRAEIVDEEFENHQ